MTNRIFVFSKHRLLAHFSDGLLGILPTRLPQVIMHERYATKSKTYYYDVLGIPVNATQGQIKTAYYMRSKMYHPDVNKNAQTDKLFSDVAEAYEILGNVRKRRLYDQGLGQRPTFSDSNVPKTGPSVFKKRGPIPTGRTSTYNFDEFYRMHYSDIRKRKQNFKEFEDKWNQELKDIRQTRIVTFVITGVFVGVLTAVLGKAWKEQNK